MLMATSTSPSLRWASFAARRSGVSFWQGGHQVAQNRDFWKGAAAVRILGSDTVDGVSSEVIAFVRPDVPAWFRVWVGTSDGLVRRADMRAEGHIMDHTYTDLNGPITVQTPP